MEDPVKDSFKNISTHVHDIRNELAKQQLKFRRLLKESPELAENKTLLGLMDNSEKTTSLLILISDEYKKYLKD